MKNLSFSNEFYSYANESVGGTHFHINQIRAQTRFDTEKAKGNLGILGFHQSCDQN